MKGLTKSELTAKETTSQKQKISSISNLALAQQVNQEIHKFLENSNLVLETQQPLVC